MQVQAALANCCNSMQAGATATVNFVKDKGAVAWVWIKNAAATVGNTMMTVVNKIVEFVKGLIESFKSADPNTKKLVVVGAAASVLGMILARIFCYGKQAEAAPPAGLVRA